MGKTTHGMDDTPEHRAWASMKMRCKNPKHAKYYAGVTICQEWQDSFEAFYRDMGPKPTPQHSIERLKSERGYEPTNCVWATKTAQARNRPGFVRPLTFQGKTQLVVEWGEELGIKPKTLYQRLRKGWSVEKVLGTPLLT